MAKQDLRLYSMPELLDRLGLQYDTYGDVAKMKCPFCDHKKAKIKINLENDGWRCPACNAKGHTLHFFSLYKLGVDIYRASASDRANAGKELYAFMEGAGAPSSRSNYTQKPRPTKRAVPVAPDSHLNSVYTVMSELSEFRLSERHRQNLRNRGLSDDVITRNGYRSFPAVEDMAVDSYYENLYQSAGGNALRKKTDSIKYLSPRRICFGLMIAHRIISQGLSVEGVPGFFKFGTYWCYWAKYKSGILIPTRNIQGQIVIWQIRLDTPTDDGQRYFTCAKGELPGHVTDSVSRCHFPIGNAPLSSQTPFLVTEGPLKADVACHLFGSPVTFSAIPGIQTTKDLLSYIPLLRKTGISEAINALDMDRLTNPNVRKGSKELAAAFAAGGIRFTDLYWGKRYATSKLIALSLVADARKLPYDKSGNVFERLDKVAAALSDAGVAVGKYLDETGHEVTFHWDPCTKGIDDYKLNFP